MSRRSLRRACSALVIAALAAPAVLGLTPVGVPLAGPTAATAQTEAALDLVSQTLWVDEQPVEFVLRVTDAPDDAALEVTIHRTPLRTVAALRESRETLPTGSRLSFFTCALDQPCDQAGVEYGSGGRVTLTLLEEEIGEALRANTGALSVVIRLVDDGTELDAFATNLLVLPEDGPDPVDVDLAFVSRVHAPVALQADGTLDVDADAVAGSAAGLADRPGLPVTVEVRPETVDALAETDPEALEGLFDALAGRPLFRTPWVSMDEEAWRAAAAEDRVIAQYARGTDTLESIAEVSPTGLVRLDADARPATLGLLRAVGTSAVVVDDAHLADAGTGLARYQPFRLTDDNGLAITALRIDAEFHSILADPDPELGAYRALADLAIASRTATTELAVVLDFDRLDPDALDVLLEGIADRPELHTVDVTALLDLEPARTETGLPVRGELVPEDHVDVTPLAAELRAATTAVDTLSAMLDPETDPIDPLRTRMLAAASADLTIEEARAYLDAVFAEVLDGTTGISVAPGERITLTDRRTDLPLTFVNDQPLPVNVEIVLSAEKLRFPEGERLRRTLRPGENTVVIPVETLASGDARVTATLLSPGGLFELGSGTVQIRSTAISGLGLVISIVALLILGAWWIRTIVRVRRNRAAATVSAESPSQGEP